MKWKKQANQSLAIALTFALALTMNVPFAAWGAGDSESVAEVQQSDDDRVASATQPLESQATPEDDNRSDPANNGPVPENGNAMVGEPSTRALPSASPAGETVGAIGPLRIFYTLDSGDERQIGSGLNDDEKSVLDELNLDPAAFEVLHLRLVAAEGFSFEKGSGYQLTDVSVSWQAITADGMTLSYGIDLRSEGDSLVCDIPSVLLRNVSNGEYERFAISWTADGAPPEIHGAAFGSYLGFNLFKTGTAAAFETDSIMGTYVSGNGTAIVIAKSSGGRTIAIADEVGSNGSPAVSTFKDVAIACDSAGEPYRTEVSVNYSTNAKFELGADADGNRTLTSLESCTYRTAQGPNAGSISKGQVFTQAMVASVQGAKYPTVQAAINAAQTGETVILLEDVQENVIVPADKSIVLDLNGQVVEGAPNADTVTVEGALTVKDDTADANPVVSDDYGSVTYAAGKILGKSPTTEPYAKALHVQNGGSATIEGGIVESEDSDAAFVSKGSTLTVNGGYFHSAEFGIGVQGEGATLVMSGGVVVADNNAAIGGNGKDEAESRDASISISGGTVISHIDADGYIACGIYHPQRGKLSITGGTVYADNGVGILLRGGTLDMTDGTVIATGNASGQVGDSTIVQSCYGVQIDGASAYYDSANAKATITGGLVKAGENVPALNVVAPGTMTANGGTFSSDVTEYLGAGRIIKENSDGMFVVESDQVASITGANGEVRKTYSSLSGAFSSVKDGETVTLLKDVPAADAQYSVSNKSFTLDLNNYSIDGTRYFTLYINRYGEPVDVTIKNGTIRNTWNGADNGPLGMAVWANQNVNLTLDNVVLEAAEAPGGKQSFGLRIGNASGNTSNPSVTIKGEDTEIAGATAGISVIGNGASAVSSLTLEAGTVSGSDFGIVGNGDCDGTSIEIKGGTVRSTSEDGCAIYHPQDGDLTVSGGTLEGANGVQFCGEGKLSIEGGSINATAAEIASSDTTTTSSSILDGAALSLVSRGGGGYGAAGSAEVSITGGTLTSANNAAIQEYAVGDAGSLIKSLAISQPEGKTLTVSSASGKPAVSLSALTGNASKVIAGGTFSSDPSDYVRVRYVANQIDGGMYHVSPKGSIEVWNDFLYNNPNDSHYKGTFDSLSEALRAAGELSDANKVVYIRGDHMLTEDATIPEGVYLYVYDNAKLTVKSGATLTVEATSKKLAVNAGSSLAVEEGGRVLLKPTGSVLFSRGLVSLNDGSTFEGILSVEDGSYLCQNGSNFYASTSPVVEILRANGSTVHADTISSATIKDGDTVTLLGDVTGQRTISANDVYVDLDGHTWSGSATTSYSTIAVSGNKVTIAHGTVKSPSASALEVSGTDSRAIIASDAIVENDGASKPAVFLKSNGSLEVQGAILAHNNFAISGNGIGADNTSVVIKDVASVRSEAAAAIYHPQTGTLEVSGGAIEGVTGVEMRSGTLNVSGNASITGTGSPFAVASNANGATTTGAGIAVVQHVTKNNIDVTISGGTISGASALSVSNPENNDEADIAKVKVSVIGGTLNAINGGADVVQSIKEDFITGGTFNKVLDTKYYEESIYQQNAQDATDEPGSVVPRAFEIKYDLGGGMLAGTAKNPASYTYFDESFTLANPERAGYTFAGWTGSGIDDGAESVTIAKGSTGNRSYTATWTANTNTAYTVEHYQQNLDGTYALAETDSLTGETDATVTAAPKAYEGFTLNEDAQGTVASGIIAGDGSLVLKLCYDRNAYDVTYKVIGSYFANDSYQVDKNVRYGAELALIGDDMSQVGYVWNGWSGLPATMPDNAVTVTGYYTAADDTAYTVRHFFQNIEDEGYTQNGVDEMTGTTGAKTKAAAKSATGFTAKPFEQADIAADGSTVVGIYYDRNVHTVSYRYKGKVPAGASTLPDPQEYRYGANIAVAPAATAPGYTFAGWSEADELVMGDADVVLYGSFTALGDTAYKVEHYQQMLDGTYELAETDRLKGQTDTTATAAPKVYEGFAPNEDAQGTVASGTIAGDGSLVLKLYYDRNSYEVSYAYTGDAPASAPALPAKATAKFDETVTPAATPTMTGYTFSGWSRAEAFAMPAGNVTITGSWAANTDVAYTVHYYLHGTTTRLSDDKVVEGRTFGQSYDEQAPAIEGYALEGAAVQRIVLDAYGKELTFSYTAKEARIAFEVNGGSQVADLVGKTGEQVAGSLPAPSREGYAFAGWYADKALTEPVSALPATYPAGATTYYAKWNAVPLPPGETGNVEIQVEVPAPPADGSPHATVTEESVEAAAKHAASVLEAIEKDEAPVGMTAEDAQKVAGLVSGADTADVRVVVSLGFEKKGEDEVDDSEKDDIGGAASDGESVQLYLDLSVKMVVQVVKDGSVQAEHEAVLGEVEEPLLFEVHVDPGLVASKSVRIAHVHGYEHDTEIIVPESIDRDRGIVRFYASKFSTYALLASESVAVDFEANGGSAVASQTIGFGSKVARPDDPTRAGYTFGGWFVDEGCTQAFDFGTPVERPLTLFAKWTAVDPGPGPNPDPDPSPNPDPDPGTDSGADHKPGDNGGSDLKPLDASSKAVGTKRLVGTGDGTGAFAASLAGVAALAVASALAAALRRRRSR